MVLIQKRSVRSSARILARSCVIEGRSWIGVETGLATKQPLPLPEGRTSMTDRPVAFGVDDEVRGENLVRDYRFVRIGRRPPSGRRTPVN